METIVCDIPVTFDPEQAAAYTGVKPGSIYFQELVGARDLYLQHAKPKAVLKWVNIEHGDDGRVLVEGHRFDSRVVNEKLGSMDRAFIYVATAGTELEDVPGLDTVLMKESLTMYSLITAMGYVMQFLTESFGYSEPGTLNPGSLPDWPISNNFALFDILGPATDQIGVSIMDSGYMRPWKSSSGIVFTDASGYQNCMLCKQLDCIGRRAEFDQVEYDRIFVSA